MSPVCAAASWLDLSHDGWPLRLLTIIGVLVAAVVVERLIVRLVRRAYWRRLEHASATPSDRIELARVQRQKTLVTLLESLIRYGVFGAALLMMLSIASGGQSRALFGASLIVVLVGFGLQRLLGDVVAGALLLFEGQFAVGDVITVHALNVTGIVSEFSLRTTTLRTLAGDEVVVLNGAMTSFTRWSHATRQHRFEVLVTAGRARQAVEQVCERESASDASSMWVVPPMVRVVEPLDGDVSRLIITATCAPAHGVLAERFAALVEAVVPDGERIGPVTSVPFDQAQFNAWRQSLLVPDNA